MNVSVFAAVFVLGSLLACGPVTPPGPTGGGSSGGLSGGGFSGTGGGTSGTGGGTSGTGGGSAGGATAGGASSSWSIAECEAAMDKFIAPNCGDVQNWIGLKAQCARIPSPNALALCGTPLQKAKACHTQFITQGMVGCVGPGTDTNETCGADVVLGVLCVGTVNAGPCAGVQCMFNADCPSGWTCNDKTDRCVNTSAACPGLPCRFNADCPTGFTCNNATEQCNRN